MSGPSPKTQAIVWGGLFIVVAVIAVSFVRSLEKPLPVYGQIPDFSLTNQLGEVVTRSTIAGQTLVADVIFTRCPSQCIHMTELLGQVQKQLDASEPIRLVSLTTDPDYDQPPVLQKYARQYKIDEHHWWLLTGAKGPIHEFAATGLKFVAAEKKPEERESAEDLFIHTTKVVLLDKTGRIRGWYSTEDPDSVATILKAARQVAREP